MGLANRMTDAKMVKNLRVVVMMEHVRGPKYTTVMKIKLCKKQIDTFCHFDWKKYNTDHIFRGKAIDHSRKNLISNPDYLHANLNQFYSESSLYRKQATTKATESEATLLWRLPTVQTNPSKDGRAREACLPDPARSSGQTGGYYK